MIITIAAVLMVGFITVAIVGVREARAGVRRLETGSGSLGGQELEEEKDSARCMTSAGTVDALQASRFTSSLLALGKAQKQLTRNSPAPEHAEPSSLESVLQPLSKNLVRES